MDDADDVEEDDGGLTWASLFGRAAVYEVEEPTVRGTLARRRGREGD